MRVVTLLPSATEIVCALGRQDALVGVSHSCDFPAGVDRLPSMTSTRVPYTESSGVIDEFVRDHLASSDALYDLDMRALAAASPDVIVSQALCDVCAVATGDVVAALDDLPSQPALVDLEPNTLDEVLDDCLRVGAALGESAVAQALVDGLEERRRVVAARSAAIDLAERPRVAFLEWLEPPFSGGHWNPELVELAGGIDILGDPGKPSRTLAWEDVRESHADVLFIACCGFDEARTAQDIEDLLARDEFRDLPAVRAGRVFIADGNAYFSRPGPRLIDGLEMMAHALHPDVHPASPLGACQRLAAPA